MFTNRFRALDASCRILGLDMIRHVALRSWPLFHFDMIYMYIYIHVYIYIYIYIISAQIWHGFQRRICTTNLQPCQVVGPLPDGIDILVWWLNCRCVPKNPQPKKTLSFCLSSKWFAENLDLLIWSMNLKISFSSIWSFRWVLGHLVSFFVIDFHCK